MMDHRKPGESWADWFIRRTGELGPEGNVRALSRALGIPLAEARARLRAALERGEGKPLSEYGIKVRILPDGSIEVVE